MQIEEIISEHAIHLNVENPFQTANMILGEASKLGTVTVAKNEFLTNGPQNIISVDFVVSDHIDNFSSAILNVSISGEQKGFLEISFETKTKTLIKEIGFFSASFANYYMEKNYSDTSKRASKLAADLEKRFEQMIKHSYSLA